MALKRGHFFLGSCNGVRKVYVQPAWMEDNKAVRLYAKNGGNPDPKTPV